MFYFRPKKTVVTNVYKDTCWLYVNGHNPKGSYILLLTVHVSLKIADFIHQCVYTDIIFYFLCGILYYVQ